VAQFETRGVVNLLQGPTYTVAADFNADGKPDIAVTNALFGVDQVSIFLGKGDGAFQTAVNYDVGAAPRSIVVADFNGDGRLDLAVANFLGASVSVLLGKGDGTFEAASQIDAPLGPSFVGVGDFNNDGKLDLVMTDDSGISVFFGNRDGTFQFPVTMLPPGPFSSIGIGDWNGDGNLDLVTVGQSGIVSEAQVLLGNGDGTFSPGATYPLDSDPVYVAVGDFNHDGILDLAVADFQGIGVAVLVGKGDGTFRASVFYRTLFASSVVAADVNHDGTLDLVAGGDGGPNLTPAVTVFLGKGDGTFKPGMAYPGGGNLPAIADFNGDHLLDIASADGVSAVTILLNTGVVSFSPTTPLNFPAQLVGTTGPVRSVSLTNTGTAPLTIASMSVKGPFQLSHQGTCGTTVAPKATCTIAATFHPTAKGAARGLISITDRASSKPQIIELTATGTVVTISPQQLSFAAQKVGTKSPPKTATLQNHGTTALDIQNISILPDYQQSNTCGSQLAPGKSCTIGIVFAPTKTGPRNGTCQITDDGGASPQKIQLAGTGS
jgi:hypothetical protein